MLVANLLSSYCKKNRLNVVEEGNLVCTDRRLRSVAKVSFFIHDVDRLLSPRPIINTKLGDRDKADTFFVYQPRIRALKRFLGVVS